MSLLNVATAIIGFICCINGYYLSTEIAAIASNKNGLQPWYDAATKRRKYYGQIWTLVCFPSELLRIFHDSLLLPKPSSPKCSKKKNDDEAANSSSYPSSKDDDTRTSTTTLSDELLLRGTCLAFSLCGFVMMTLSLFFEIFSPPSSSSSSSSSSNTFLILLSIIVSGLTWIFYVLVSEPAYLFFPWHCLLGETLFLLMIGQMAPFAFNNNINNNNNNNNNITSPFSSSPSSSSSLYTELLLRFLLVRLMWGFAKTKFATSNWSDRFYLLPFLRSMPMPSPIGLKAAAFLEKYLEAEKVVSTTANASDDERDRKCANSGHSFARSTCQEHNESLVSKLLRMTLVLSYGFFAFAEIVSPFFILFAPRETWYWTKLLMGHGPVALLMLGIQISGNFGFFPLLTATLSVASFGTASASESTLGLVYDVYGRFFYGILSLASSSTSSSSSTASPVSSFFSFEFLLSFVYVLHTTFAFCTVPLISWIAFSWSYTLLGFLIEKTTALTQRNGYFLHPANLLAGFLQNFIQFIFAPIATFFTTWRLCHPYGIFPPHTFPAARLGQVYEWSVDGGKRWHKYRYKYQMFNDQEEEEEEEETLVRPDNEGGENGAGGDFLNSTNKKSMTNNSNNNNNNNNNRDNHHNNNKKREKRSPTSTTRLLGSFVPFIHPHLDWASFYPFGFSGGTSLNHAIFFVSVCPFRNYDIRLPVRVAQCLVNRETTRVSDFFEAASLPPRESKQFAVRSRGVFHLAPWSVSREIQGKVLERHHLQQQQQQQQGHSASSFYMKPIYLPSSSHEVAQQEPFWYQLEGPLYVPSLTKEQLDREIPNCIKSPVRDLEWIHPEFAFTWRRWLWGGEKTHPLHVFGEERGGLSRDDVRILKQEAASKNSSCCFLLKVVQTLRRSVLGSQESGGSKIQATCKAFVNHATMCLLQQNTLRQQSPSSSSSCWIGKEIISVAYDLYKFGIRLHGPDDLFFSLISSKLLALTHFVDCLAESEGGGAHKKEKKEDEGETANRGRSRKNDDHKNSQNNNNNNNNGNNSNNSDDDGESEQRFAQYFHTSKVFLRHLACLAFVVSILSVPLDENEENEAKNCQQLLLTKLLFGEVSHDDDDDDDGAVCEQGTSNQSCGRPTVEDVDDDEVSSKISSTSLRSFLGRVLFDMSSNYCGPCSELPHTHDKRIQEQKVNSETFPTILSVLVFVALHGPSIRQEASLMRCLDAMALIGVDTSVEEPMMGKAASPGYFWFFTRWIFNWMPWDQTCHVGCVSGNFDDAGDGAEEEEEKEDNRKNHKKNVERAPFYSYKPTKRLGTQHVMTRVHQVFDEEK